MSFGSKESTIDASSNIQLEGFICIHFSYIEGTKNPNPSPATAVKWILFGGKECSDRTGRDGQY